jgi:hypothetical protein
MTYSIPNNFYDEQPSTTIICRTNEDGTETWIPTDPANSDYQAYLASQENN